MNFYKHYLEVKKQNSDALVFYRVGDFYELFGQDAVTASEVLNLTLTSRDCETERVPMCGVPCHSVDGYIAKLVQNGHKTAICEPSNDLPKPKQSVSEPVQQAQGRINLTATGTEQTILKEYLEANASDVLIEKINNGVRIQKDGKTLISKKTLETFLAYACEEARKQAAKGARSACLGQDIVFGWLIHYFEESTIEGTLYNEDGTEYKPPKPVSKTNTAKTTTAAVVAPPKEKPKAQFSLFDMLEPKTEKAEIEAATALPETGLDETDTEELPVDELDADETDTEAEIDAPVSAAEETPEDEEDYPKGLHQISETQWADEDGVIYDVVETKKETVPDALIKLFGNLIIAR